MSRVSHDSPNIVKRVKLADRVLLKMREDLDAGIWGQYLPGIRSLMQRYCVSRPPVEEALKQLESMELIGPAKGTRRRKILITAPNRLSSSSYLAIVRPSFENLSALSREIRARVIGMISESAQPFIEIPVNEFNPKELDTQILTYGGRDITHVIGLDVSYEFTRNYFPSPLPILQFGEGNSEDKHCSSVALSIGQAMEEAVYQALTTKCREVCLAEMGLPPGNKTKFGSYIERAYKRANKRFLPEFHTPYLEDSKVGATLREAVRARPIDLVLTTKEYAWSRAIYELQCAGITCPVYNIIYEQTFSLFDVAPAFIAPILEDYDACLLQWLADIEQKKVSSFHKLVRTRNMY